MHRVIPLLTLGLFPAWCASAGDLVPPGPPAPTMRSMQEVYDETAAANRAAGGGDALLVYPHVVEKAGSISTTQYTFDTSFYFVATAPYVAAALKAGGPSEPPKSDGDVTVHLYLYDHLGEPAKSATAALVAFPADVTVGYATPRASLTLEALFQAAGGYAGGAFQGFVVLSVSSGDWNDVAVQGFTINSHASAFDLSITALEPVRVQDSPAAIKNAGSATKDAKQ